MMLLSRRAMRSALVGAIGTSAMAGAVLVLHLTAF